LVWIEDLLPNNVTIFLDSKVSKNKREEIDESVALSSDNVLVPLLKYSTLNSICSI
jgi:hypothetical protein